MYWWHFNGLTLFVLCYICFLLAEDYEVDEPTEEYIEDEIESRRSGNGKNDITMEKYPFLAFIHFKKAFSCGGSIISELHVLSAMQNVYTGNISGTYPLYTVVVGGYPSKESEHKEVERILHPSNWEESIDISIIVLKDKLTWQLNIQPISLLANAPTVHGRCLWLRWLPKKAPKSALRQSNLSLKLPLEEIVTTVQAYDLCSKYTKLRKTKQCCLCTNYIELRNSCQLDLGNPLLCKNKLAGVSTLRPACLRLKDKTVLHVYTNVTNYRKWIETITDVDFEHDEGLNDHRTNTEGCSLRRAEPTKKTVTIFCLYQIISLFNYFFAV